MTITVFLDNYRGTLPFYSKGTMETYELVGDKWKRISYFEIDLSKQKDLRNIQDNVNKLNESLGKTDMLVLKSIMGLPKALLSEHGIGVWTFEGLFLIDLLCFIKSETDKVNKEIRNRITTPTLKSLKKEGVYEINLTAVLEENPRLNSMDVLVPFIKTTNFKLLNIICTHPPKWLTRSKDDLQLKIETEELDNTYLVAHVLPIKETEDISFRRDVYIAGQGGCSSGGC